jgi:hypothetical protein
LQSRDINDLYHLAFQATIAKFKEIKEKYYEEVLFGRNIIISAINTTWSQNWKSKTEHADFIHKA